MRSIDTIVNIINTVRVRTGMTEEIYSKLVAFLIDDNIDNEDMGYYDN